MKKVYYQLKMSQLSPLRIGNGENDTTDNDLMCDSRGIPFIPGSSVAGVLRDRYEKITGKSPDVLFGNIIDDNISESHIIVSDAVGSCNSTIDDYKITIRDGVGLDKWGVAKEGHKYDFQVVETENQYSCILEWSGDEDEYINEVKQGLDILVDDLIRYGIRFGARTTRGYGKMKVEAGMDGSTDEKAALDFLFGKSKEDNTLSKIRFGETIIEGGKPYQLTRNAVERFTQAPKNSALFTDEFWYGGEGTLEIVVEKDKMSKLQKQLLEVALLDLDYGILTFGAETGTGHGRVEVINLKVNGIDKTESFKSGRTGFLEEIHE